MHSLFLCVVAIWPLILGCTQIRSWFHKVSSSSQVESVDYLQPFDEETLFWKTTQDNASAMCYYFDFLHLPLGSSYEDLYNSRLLTLYPVETDALVSDLTRFTDLSADKIRELLEAYFLSFQPSIPEDIQARISSFDKISQREALLLLPQVFADHAGPSIDDLYRAQKTPKPTEELTKLKQAFLKRLLEERSKGGESSVEQCDPDSSIFIYLAFQPDRKSGTKKLWSLRESSCSELDCDFLFPYMDVQTGKNSDKFAHMYCLALRQDRGCGEAECAPCSLSLDSDQLLECFKKRKNCPGYNQIIKTLDL